MDSPIQKEEEESSLVMAKHLRVPACALLQAADQMHGQCGGARSAQRAQHAHREDCKHLASDLVKHIQHAQTGGQEEKRHVLQQKIRGACNMMQPHTAEDECQQEQYEPQHIAGQRTLQEKRKGVTRDAAREQDAQLLQDIQVFYSSFLFSVP